MAQAKQKAKPKAATPLPDPWIAVWYRANNVKPFGVDGSERPCLMRDFGDERSLLLLTRDEITGIKTVVIPLSDAHYVRPMQKLNGTEYDPSKIMAQYREYAVSRGASAEACREMGISIPTPSSAAPTGPEKTGLTELYWRAAKLCEEEESTIRERYAHMNPGMQAMQLRGLLKRKGWNA